VTNHNRGQDKSGGGGNPTAAEKKYIALAIQALNSTYKTSKDEDGKRDNTHLKYALWTAAAATIYTVITAALLAAGIWSAVQASNAVTQAARAVGEAKRAADAAQAQVGVSTDTEHRQLRAYVGPSPGDIENVGDETNQRFTFQRKNFGVTPAYDVSLVELTFGIIVSGQPIPVLTQFNEIPRGTPTIFPSSQLVMNIAGDIINHNVVNQLSTNSNLRFVYSGTVKYRDAFDQTHYTNFCWMFEANAFTAKDADWCQGHNDSD
jgi:hypothetical protein